MILSRAKPAIKPTQQDHGSGSAQTKTKHLPKLEEYLSARDYTGAMALLEFNRNSGKASDELDLWLGYCAFHCGDYKRAMLEYEALTHVKKPPKDAFINLACCFFYLGMYHEAEKMCDKADKSQLRTRLKFHLAHKFGDEKKLMTFHQELEDVTEDQLSLASIHYLRSHYQVIVLRFKIKNFNEM